MDTLEFLKSYDIRTVGSGRGDAPSAAAGITMKIAAYDDPVRGKIIDLRSGAHHAERLMPLEEFQAEEMVARFVSAHEHHGGEKELRTLAHLLVKVSHMYLESGIERCDLDVSLHENGYSVRSAQIRSAHPLHVTKRVVHDPKQAIYQPTGKP
jgi:hypothetical protein